MKYFLILLLFACSTQKKATPWWGDNTYAETVFGSEKVTRLDFPEGYHILPANDTLPDFFRHSGSFAIGYDSTGLCKHIYVATSPDTVEPSCHIQGDYAIGGWAVTVPGIVYNIGSHSADHDAKNMAEGISIICVKCFHQTRQKIHYKHKESNLPDDTTGRGYKSFWHPAKPRLTTESRESHFYLDNPPDSVTYIMNGPPGGTTRLATDSTKRLILKGVGKTWKSCTCAGGMPHVH